ncbi:putative GPI-anchor transamidase [Trifolium repens]|nr:putative GPI-anchor transamidase [Trifolium repens]
MLPDDMPCNPRNDYPSQIFNNKNHKLNLYGENVEVDYRGYEVNLENFLRPLTGRHQPNTPRSKHLSSPGVLAIGSSVQGEESYSHHFDYDLGAAVVDRFTFYTLAFFERINLYDKDSLSSLFHSYNPSLLDSTPYYRTGLYLRRLEEVPVTDFFGYIAMPFSMLLLVAIIVDAAMQPWWWIV